MNRPRPSRRTLLQAPAALAVAGFAATDDGEPRGPAAFSSVGLDDFGSLWRSLFDAAIAGEDFPDDTYVARLASLVHRLRAGEIPRLGEASYERDGLASGGIWGDATVGLVELRLEPGAVIPAHNHVAYNFLTLCLEGDCEYRHFRPAAGAPEPSSEGTSDWFGVDEVKSGLLEPGRATTLTRTWDNIHWFRAGVHGATLIDFMTHLPEVGEGYSEFSALEVGEQSATDGRRRRKGRWIGNPF